MLGYSTTVIISQSRLPMPITEPNEISLCTIFGVPNVIIMIGLILATALNVFPDSLFINPFGAHAVFERSTDREWHNSSGDSKTTRTLRKQLTLIYCNVLV